MAEISRRSVLTGSIGAGVTALGGLGLPFEALAAAAPRDPLLVATSGGLVRGRIEEVMQGRKGEAVRVFTGIPYGTAARFAVPRPARAWHGEWDATRPPRAAPQPEGFDPLPATQAEDCLQLNVWAPAAPGRYPVVVWIHGGANETGWSGAALTTGERFAAQGVICVSVNYRLGALGYCELGHVLGRGYAGSGNNGIRDLVLALQWVRANIAAFGGNPGRVTLMGESAGGKNVVTLMATPAADGLYARAIVCSGGGQTVYNPGEAAAFANAVVARLGGRERLLVAPFPAIIEAQVAARREWPRNMAFRAVVDGTFLPQMPLTRMVEGRVPRVPLLVGSNADESRLFLSPAQAAKPLWSQQVSNETMARMATLNRSYAQAYPELSEAERRWKLLTAEEYGMPNLRLAEAHAARGASVWHYRLALPAPGGQHRGSSPHVLDVPLTFDHVTNPVAAQMFGYSAAEQPVADAWHGAMVAFIKGGAPSTPAWPAWPRFKADRRASMMVARTASVVDDLDRAERALWGE